jgi:hypothetical protein
MPLSVGQTIKVGLEKCGQERYKKQGVITWVGGGVVNDSEVENMAPRSGGYSTKRNKGRKFNIRFHLQRMSPFPATADITFTENVSISCYSRHYIYRGCLHFLLQQTLHLQRMSPFPASADITSTEDVSISCYSRHYIYRECLHFLLQQTLHLQRMSPFPATADITLHNNKRAPPHPKPTVQQIRNYTQADLTKLYTKYKHKRTNHILL